MLRYCGRVVQVDALQGCRGLRTCPRRRVAACVAAYTLGIFGPRLEL